MVVYEDTRQQRGKHDNISAQLSAMGITIKRTKLANGDYVVPPPISVDTKAGMPEVYQDIVGDHERFRNECIRAKEDGTKLIILVECDDVRRIEDVEFWKNPLTKRGIKTRPSKAVMRSMQTMAEKYGIVWEFCSKAQTGKRIIELLTEGSEDNG